MSPSPGPPREAVSIAVVTEVSARKGVDPAAMTPLYETVDPDAVDALLEREFEGTIEFEYEGCTVRVRGDGTIRVDAPDRYGDDHPIGTTTRSFSGE